MDEREKRELHRRKVQEQAARRKRKKKKSGGILNTIVLIAAVVLFCYSAFELYKIFSSYKKGDDEYREIQNIAITQEKPKTSGDGKKKEAKFTVDFAKLRKINPDTVAWIRFDEPSVINYPVVHSKDNNEYLTRLFGEGKNTYGTLFVDKDNEGDFTDKNTFIYGHRMKSGSMFGKLEKYAKESFYKEHPYFYIYTPDGRECKYQVFSAGVVKATSDAYRKSYADEEEFKNYIQKAKAESNYQTDAPVTEKSEIVSLSTCTVDSNEDRFLLRAVKVSEK